MDNEQHARLTGALLPLVVAAGAIEMRYYAGTVTVESKADDSPVTAADREAEALILAGLARIAPDIPVVAEEAVAEGRVPAIARRFFLVDPLDGTREFINKRDEFTVNIALVEDGRPILGLVYAPAMSHLYVTLGARRAAEARVAPDARIGGLGDVRLVEITTRAPDPKALVAVASRSHSTPETAALLARYPISAQRNAGSSLKFGLLARGEADFYPRLGPTREWDIAAGHAVLAAAGGTVVTLEGTPLLYGKADQGFASPHFVAWGRTPLPPA